MTRLCLENVTVDYPIYGSSRTFRGILKRRTGGFIKREIEGQGRVVVRALESLSLDLNHGDRLGIVGHNGAGKSTLLRVCAGVYEPSDGRVILEGKVSSLLNTAPGLDPDDTGYENIMTCGLFLGMTRKEIVRKTPEIEEFTELGEYLDLPARTYSAGMLTRLGFAIATAIDPEILVLDEGLGAGDARFAEKAKARVNSLIDRTSILILASHSEGLIQAMCSKAILLDTGKIKAVGSTNEIIAMYRERSMQAG